MKLGLFGINMGRLADPAASALVARAAEQAGFESLWAGEHVALPDPRTKESPLPPHFPMLDPVVTLSHLAAVTRTVRLGTGIIILPQRNPVVLAKELATLDVLSGGRLIFGMGVGYLKPEFDAIGAAFAERGARADEYLAAMRALWAQPKPAFAGRFVRFAEIDAQPRPVQKPYPAVVVGGWTEAALRRALSAANGWYGFNMEVEIAARHIASLRRLAGEVERDAALGPLEISVTPPRRTIDRATAEAYRGAGVDRLILQYTAPEPDAVAAEMAAAADRLRDIA